METTKPKICKECGEEMFVVPTGLFWCCPCGHGEIIQHTLNELIKHDRSK